MQLTTMIVDDFYADPNSVRSFALSQNFSVKGNFPGSRTQAFLAPHIKQAIQFWMNFAGTITNWYEDTGYSGCFQVATAKDRTWIHSDRTQWAGVCYLSPDPPFTSGTGFYRHKQTGENFRVTDDHEAYDYTKWDLFDSIGNKYNRLIIYRGDLFHASLDYFGDNLHNGRLFQTFFFDTQ